MIVVSDTTPLISLLKVGRLDLLVAGVGDFKFDVGQIMLNSHDYLLEVR